MAPLPEQAYAAALASLPGCGPARLLALVTTGRALEDVWRDVASGRIAHDSAVVRVLAPRPDVAIAGWRSAAARLDVDEEWRRVTDANVRVLVHGRVGYPQELGDDHEPPGVLFTTAHAADLAHAARPRAAIVGTRRCTGYGADVARVLGRELTRAGVSVVSGLAAGVDGAAHEGALVVARDADTDDAGVARPVAVVGSGLDVVYPRRHKRLWREVAEHGVVLSEAPLGARPEPWRFPLRNRIIAALADVVVVVESHAKGGSMHTVHAAIDRNKAVMAVPGSVHSPASAGTNKLLADGIPPVLDVDDVLVALALDARPVPQRRDRIPLDPVAEAVLAAVDWSATATEDILRRAELELGAAAAALARLEMAGLVRGNGGYWERIRAP